jgi:hypothetical protein
VNNFLLAIEDVFGVPQSLMFTPADVVESKNHRLVLSGLALFAKTVRIDTEGRYPPFIEEGDEKRGTMTRSPSIRKGNQNRVISSSPYRQKSVSPTSSFVNSSPTPTNGTTTSQFHNNSSQKLYQPRNNAQSTQSGIRRISNSEVNNEEITTNNNVANDSNKLNSLDPRALQFNESENDNNNSTINNNNNNNNSNATPTHATPKKLPSIPQDKIGSVRSVSFLTPNTEHFTVSKGILRILFDVL